MQVKVRQEVKETIERIRINYTSWDERALCYIILNPHGYCQYSHDPDIVLVHKWSQNNEFAFAKGLLNGFEAIEEPEVKTITPEQKAAAIALYRLERTTTSELNSFTAIRRAFKLIGIEWEELR